jgi:hypothetical protein
LLQQRRLLRLQQLQRQVTLAVVPRQTQQQQQVVLLRPLMCNWLCRLAAAAVNYSSSRVRMQVLLGFSHQLAALSRGPLALQQQWQQQQHQQQLLRRAVAAQQPCRASS